MPERSSFGFGKSRKAENINLVDVVKTRQLIEDGGMMPKSKGFDLYHVLKI